MLVADGVAPIDLLLRRSKRLQTNAIRDRKPLAKSEPIKHEPEIIEIDSGSETEGENPRYTRAKVAKVSFRSRMRSWNCIAERSFTAQVELKKEEERGTKTRAGSVLGKSDRPAKRVKREPLSVKTKNGQ